MLICTLCKLLGHVQALRVRFPNLGNVLLKFELTLAVKRWEGPVSIRHMHHPPFLGNASSSGDLPLAACVMFTSKGNPFASLQPFRDEAALPKSDRGVPNASSESTVPQALIAPAAVVATQTWDTGGVLCIGTVLECCGLCLLTMFGEAHWAGWHRPIFCRQMVTGQSIARRLPVHMISPEPADSMCFSP